ncbi:RNA-binding S4 domain-containing protein [Bacteroidota bacterium]
MKKVEDEIRIDKWLWSVRIFKTRNKATEACKKGKVIIRNIPVKPSRIIKENEIIDVKKNPVMYTYKVKALISKRVSAKMVDQFIEDLTSEEELMKLEMNDYSGFFVREKGNGRPTKKERRILDQIKNDNH